MGYFRHLIAVLLTCGVQYACSFGLIVLGYYSNWIYYVGGFIIWIIVFLGTTELFGKLFFKLFTKKDKNTKRDSEMRTSHKVMLFFVLGATFWVNYKLIEVHDNYEYDNYGVTVKAIIAEKSTSRAAKGGTFHHIVFSFTQNSQEIIRKYSPEKEEYQKLRAGDSLTIMYSTRNTYFTEKFTKIVP